MHLRPELGSELRAMTSALEVKVSTERVSCTLRQGIVELRAPDDARIAEILEALGLFEASISLASPAPLLIDTRETGARPSAAEMQQFATYLSLHQQTFAPYRAVVVSSALLWGLGRMAMVFAEQQGACTRVFRRIDAARDWLRAKTQA